MTLDPNDATHPDTSTGTTSFAGASPARWWLIGLAVLIAVTLARLPTVVDAVSRQVEARIARGDLPEGEQTGLAINLGVSIAITIYVTVQLILVSIARRLEARCRLWPVPIGRWRVPGLLFLVIGTATAVQATALALQASTPRSEPAVWVAAVAVAVTVVAFVQTVRSGAGPPALVRLLACGLTVTATCLVL
jgi:hypothetical protein